MSTGRTNGVADTTRAAAKKATAHTDEDGVIITTPVPTDDGSWHRGAGIVGENSAKEEEEALAFLLRFFSCCKESLVM